MGDFSSSDCSWKKIVIAKANNEWISTMRSEQHDAGDSVNTADFKLTYVNVKQEYEDTSEAEQSFSTSCDDSESIIPEGVPDRLMVTVKRKRRRKSSISEDSNQSRTNETPEGRAARLAKMSAYAARRLANETPEQRALRLKRMSEYAARRISKETQEQRAQRLSRMSAYSARRLASETPEQREQRLAKMSAYSARRQALKKHCASTSQDAPNSPNSDYDIAFIMPE